MAPTLFSFGCVFINKEKQTSFVLKSLLSCCTNSKARKLKLKNTSISVSSHRVLHKSTLVLHNDVAHAKRSSHSFYSHLSWFSATKVNDGSVDDGYLRQLLMLQSPFIFKPQSVAPSYALFYMLPHLTLSYICLFFFIFYLSSNQRQQYIVSYQQYLNIKSCLKNTKCLITPILRLISRFFRAFLVTWTQNHQ